MEKEYVEGKADAGIWKAVMTVNVPQALHSLEVMIKLSSKLQVNIHLLMV